MSRRILTASACVVVMLAMAEAVHAQQREPSIGYVYPAGGQRGTTVEVLVGGQGLRAANGVYLSGNAVRATVVKHYPAVRNISGEQRIELQRQMREAGARQWAKLQEQGKVGAPPIEFRPPPPKPPTTRPVGAVDEGKLPSHWMFDDLENKSLQELMHIRHLLQLAPKRQPNEQIGETVLVRIEIGALADFGERELRLVGRTGLTNPVVFQVGVLPEVREYENNDPDARSPLPAEPPFEVPVTINGQIHPGDVDRLRFAAKAGQRLVIRTHARRLVPFLADAVPGWFEAAVAVRHTDGKVLAYADHYQFDPDPVLLFQPPADGQYVLEIRDTIYRGRDDFVYRVSISESPFITAMAPVGVRVGERPTATIQGWNLWTDKLPLTARNLGVGVHQARLSRGREYSNDVLFHVTDLPTVAEQQTNNNAIAPAQTVSIGQMIDGTIDPPGDVDYFRFRGSAGQEIVAEIIGRRMGSPVDSLVRVMDARGKVLAWNDDLMVRRGILHPDYGLQTHHADSYLTLKLPMDGWYLAQVSDAQAAGGPQYAYRLRLSPPRPDFQVFVTPSAVSLEAGRWLPLTAHVIRRDGFDGEITLDAKDAPAGFALSGARIPPGVDSVRFTVTPGDKRTDGISPIKLQAASSAGGARQEVTPADEVEQAFLWRHLVPREQMLVFGRGNARASVPGRLESSRPLMLKPGASVQVAILDSRLSMAKVLKVRGHDLPAGITVEAPSMVSGKIMVQIRASADAKPGSQGNLILEAQSEVSVKRADGQTAVNTISLGWLPAIAYQVSPR